MDKIEKLADEMIQSCKQERDKRRNHIIQMESKRAIAITLNPFENILQVYSGNPLGKSLAGDKEDVKKMLKPSKIKVLDKILQGYDMPDYHSYSFFEKLSADVIKKDIFRKNIIDQAQNIYKEQRDETWKDELERNKRYFQPSFLMDEKEMFGKCRWSKNNSRVDCAKAIDKAEPVCLDLKLDLPIENPIEKDFIKAIDKHY